MINHFSDRRSHEKTALPITFRPGGGGAAARHRARHGDAGFRRRPEDLQRRLPQADLDDRGADRVLRRGARHRRRRRPQEGRAGRRQGADLFRGDDHGRAGRRPAAGLSVRPRPRHEHRHLDARRQGAVEPTPTTPTSCRAAASAASCSTSSRPPRSTRCRATTCCRCCSSPSCSASAWRWSAARRARRSPR